MSEASLLQASGATPAVAEQHVGSAETQQEAKAMFGGFETQLKLMEAEKRHDG